MSAALRTPPRFETERLVLRMPVPSDFADHAQTLGDPVRSKFIGGPFPIDKAREELEHLESDWASAGLGGWCVEVKETGKFAGVVSINNPEHFPEIEFGWVFQADAEGLGYAYEAVVPMRQYAFGEIGLKTAVSYIDPDNARSIKLAERLGAILDPEAPTSDNDPCLVYRHSKPEAVQ